MSNANIETFGVSDLKTVGYALERLPYSALLNRPKPTSVDDLLEWLNTYAARLGTIAERGNEIEKDRTRLLNQQRAVRDFLGL